MIRKSLQVVFIISVVLLIDGRVGVAKDRILGQPDACDAGLAIDSADPLDAARAIDICKMAAGPDDWGLISAAWVMANGAAAVNDADYALGHGILSNYGVNVAVRNGERLLNLSTGKARRPTDPGYVAPVGGYDKGYTGNHPTGFPQTATVCLADCPLTGSLYDDAALSVTLRAPWNAIGFSFDFKFYTSNYPNFVCSSFDDLFIAILSPFPDGSTDGNIAFDPNGDPVRTGESLLQFCTPGPGCYTCALGTTELVGTGYENHAGSPWLTATEAVVGGAVISLRFAIYDSGDGTYDSSALIDNFQWLLAPPQLWLPLIVQ